MLTAFLLQLIILIFLKPNTTSKLWVKQNIGEVTNWYYNKKSNKAYVSTKQGVIASLDLFNNGKIIWRQVLDTNDIINQFEMSLDKKTLISLSNGNVLRKWKKIDGSLIWESAQFNNNYNDENNIHVHNAHMQILDNNKIILLDNFNVLSVYDFDEGTLIWKQSVNSNHNKTHKHKIYADQISKIVYIITWYARYVIVDSYSLTTGEFMRSANKYLHECSSLPSQFEVLNIFNIDELSLIIWYDCNPNDITPLYAFLFSIDLQQITPLSLSFDITKPKLTNWKLNKENRENKYTLSAQYCQLYDIKISIQSKSIQLILLQKECTNWKLNKENRGKIKKIWKSNMAGHMGILTEDGSLCFISSPNKEKAVDWCREEALSLPQYVYLFDESKDESSFCSKNMNEIECENVFFNAPFPSFSKRLINDITSILNPTNINLQFINKFFPITSSWLDITFEKIITIFTYYGKLFGISSSNGNILWSINLKYLCNKDNDSNYEIIKMLSIRQHPPHLLAILSDKILNKSKIVSISSPFHTFETPHINIESVDYYIQNAFVTPWLNKDHSDKITVLIANSDNSFKIKLYHPFNNETFDDIDNKKMNSIFYHTVSSNNETISGYSIQNNINTLIWNKSFKNSDELIVDIVFSLHDQFVVNSVYRTGERGSIYKYLNPHLIGIATVERKHDLLHIYLMDGITGRIYLHQYHNYVEIQSGISLLLYENKFIYTYFNKQTLLTEIQSIDLWLSNPSLVPTKGRTPSEGYIVTDNPLGNNNIFSSFNSPLPYVTSQAYNFILSIDKLLCVSQTQYSVSNKWILVKLSTGSIIQIDGKWLNTRRPINYESTQANKEEQLIPYKKNIPFNNLWTLSHSNTLNRINNAISVASPIESTSLLFAYGNLDLFYTLIKPSKNFDTIPYDFDYPMLALILSGVVVAIIVAKKMAQSKKIKKEWK